MSRRKAVAGLVAGVTTTTATMVVGVAAAAPAGAGQTTSANNQYLMSGDYLDDPQSSDEMFLYTKGLAPDAMFTFSRVGGPGSAVTKTTHPFEVSGDYIPVTGDFDGDGWDEIVWHAPGTDQDWLWNFDGSATPTISEITVNGAYLPVAGDFTGDGTDDILWYGKGSAADYLWEYDAGGTQNASAITVGGDYYLLAASFGGDATDDLFLYAPGAAEDYLWDFVPGRLSHTSTEMSQEGDYLPFVADLFADGQSGADIFWHDPNGGPDEVWDFVDGEPFTFPADISGAYLPISGSFLGDAHSDIVWTNQHGWLLWDYAPGSGGGVVRHEYDYLVTTGNASAIAADGASEATSQTATARRATAVSR